MYKAQNRPLNRLLRLRVDSSGKRKNLIALAAGFPSYIDFYETLRASSVRATPLVVGRLQRVAEFVGFPSEQIFLDEAGR